MLSLPLSHSTCLFPGWVIGWGAGGLSSVSRGLGYGPLLQLLDIDLPCPQSLCTLPVLQSRHQLFTHWLGAFVHPYSLSCSHRSGVLSSLPPTKPEWPVHSEAALTHFYVATFPRPLLICLPSTEVLLWSRNEFKATLKGLQPSLYGKQRRKNLISKICDLHPQPPKSHQVSISQREPKFRSSLLSYSTLVSTNLLHTSSIQTRKSFFPPQCDGKLQFYNMQYCSS